MVQFGKGRRVEDEGSGTQGETARRVLIWDRPTRIFHWVLAILFVVCFVSGSQGRFDIHIPAGQALLVSVVARIIWGFVGSETSRLSRLVRSPATVLAYVREVPRRVPDRYGGHNPLGGLSVLAMLLMLMLHTGLGLFAADVDGLHEGPLSFLVSYDLARQASELHALAVDILLGLVGLHLAAILFHLVYKRENLTGAMVTGRGPVPAGLQEPRIAGDGRAVLVLAIAVMVVIGGIELAQRVL